MALLNLDKIVLSRVVLGPGCPFCSSELLEIVQDNAGQRPWWMFWAAKRSAARYECKGCGRRYWLKENRSKN